MNKVCGNCKLYRRCEMFVEENNTFAERCALYERKVEMKKDDAIKMIQYLRIATDCYHCPIEVECGLILDPQQSKPCDDAIEMAIGYIKASDFVERCDAMRKAMADDKNSML